MTRTSWTPGRVNLMGEWVDFNGGLVLPAALPLGVTVSLAPSDSDQDLVTSGQFTDAVRAPLDQTAKRSWADYVLGALQLARQKRWLHTAMRVHLDSDVPPGAGVSSSAAVTVGVLKAAAPAGTDLTEIARLARSVENDYIGVPCGIMDQMAVAHAEPGEAIALDTDKLTFKRLPIPQGWRLSVIHSGVERQLADGQYKQRRDACLQAAQHLGVDALCHAKDLSTLPPDLYPIARHVVSEETRTRTALEAWRAGDGTIFGACVTGTHISLRDDFRVSTPDVDALVDTALDLGVAGARITGAGFGGCIVAVVTKDTPLDWKDDLLARHPGARWICDIDPVVVTTEAS